MTAKRKCLSEMQGNWFVGLPPVSLGTVKIAALYVEYYHSVYPSCEAIYTG